MLHAKTIITCTGLFITSTLAAQNKTSTPPNTHKTDTAMINKQKRLAADAKASKRNGAAYKYPKNEKDSMGKNGVLYHIDTSRKDNYIIPQ